MWLKSWGSGKAAALRLLKKEGSLSPKRHWFLFPEGLLAVAQVPGLGGTAGHGRVEAKITSENGDEQ